MTPVAQVTMMNFMYDGVHVFYLKQQRKAEKKYNWSLSDRCESNHGNAVRCDNAKALSGSGSPTAHHLPFRAKSLGRVPSHSNKLR